VGARSVSRRQIRRQPGLGHERNTTKYTARCRGWYVSSWMSIIVFLVCRQNLTLANSASFTSHWLRQYAQALSQARGIKAAQQRHDAQPPGGTSQATSQLDRSRRSRLRVVRQNRSALWNPWQCLNPSGSHTKRHYASAGQVRATGQGCVMLVWHRQGCCPVSA